MPPRTEADDPGTEVSMAAMRPPVRLSAVATVAPAAVAFSTTMRACSSMAFCSAAISVGAAEGAAAFAVLAPALPFNRWRALTR